MTRDLHEKIGSVIPENLFAGLEPSALKAAGTIAKGDAEATYVRGTLLAKGADGKLIVIGSDADEGSFSATGDGTKTKFSLIDGGVIPTGIKEVKVDGTAVTAYTYNSVVGELEFEEAPGNTKAIAVTTLIGGGNADCVLAEDVTVGTENDENVLVYIAGNFNADELIVAEGYEISAADKDLLRMKGIILGTSQEENV